MSITATEEMDMAAFLGLPPEPTPAPATGGLPSFIEDIAPEKKKGKQRTIYPTLNDVDGVAASLAKRSLELAGCKDELDSNNRLLGDLITPHWFRMWRGKSDVESGIRVVSDQGPVLAVCTNKLKKMTNEKQLDAVRPIFKGAEKSMFFWTYALKVDPDEIPVANHPAFVAELKALIGKHGGSKDTLKADKEFKPYPSFFTQRHVMFSPEENMEINRAMPLITMIRVKDVL